MILSFFGWTIESAEADEMKEPNKRTYKITALQRGLGLLRLFAGTDRGLPAAELAKLSKLPVSTVHRFLVNLEATGFLSCDANGVYRLGVACVSLGQAAREHMDIRRVCLLHLEDLNRRTRETVHLTVRHGLTAVYVEKLDSLEPLRIFSRIGASVPLHCTAVGKVLLACLPPNEQEQVLNQLSLQRFTENTVGSIQELQTQLKRVQRDGYAYDLEEHELHIRCIAAPIRDHSGSVNASFSVTGPAVRMSAARMKEIALLLKKASANISRDMGYEGSHLERGAKRFSNELKTSNEKKGVAFQAVATR
jgi:IclR family acetate operon transcriptional repressor